VLDAAGVENAAETCSGINSPGRSILDLLLRGQGNDWRDAQFCEYGNARMIRSRDAKLICRYPGPNGHFGDEFYDLVTDPRERKNVIDDPKYADRLALLREQLEAFFARFENPARSGKNIASQPRCNNSHPWEHEISP
jgi:arylsulfatase A-like enzyme